ncbi:testis-specific H1 histone [Talpa occidentalis]|uniref:testis-specific H1 histone n=1 Tax=Talpa occidentalis TaxID=50954 RepID=UPI00188EDA30|nr:testis-specific H1 histone [Talpa occidentalis]
MPAPEEQKATDASPRTGERMPAPEEKKMVPASEGRRKKGKTLFLASKVLTVFIVSPPSLSLGSSLREGAGQWPRGGGRRGGSGAMAEAAQTGGESKGTEGKTQQPVEKTPGGAPRREPRSVLKVSQLLLRAITAHRGLTLAALKRELGNAGYEVRRKCCRHAGDAARPDTKGTLLRVSGSEAAGYFRVWKIPKAKRKPARPRFEEGTRSLRRPLAASRGQRRSPARRRARKAREALRRRRVASRARRARARAREPARSRTKVEARAKVDEGRGRTPKEDVKPRTREQKRPSTKAREENEKPVRRTIQKPTQTKNDPSSSGQGKAHDSRTTRSKTYPKAESPQTANGNP